MKKLTGLTAVQGYAAGIIACIPDEAAVDVPAYAIAPSDIHREKERFCAALQAAQTQTAELLTRLAVDETATSAPEKAILETHSMMLHDEVFIQSVYDELEHSLYNVEKVLKQKIDETVDMMSSVNDPVFKARAIDMRDAFEPVFSYLLQKQEKQTSRFFSIPERALIAARVIKPSEALELKKLHPVGVVMEEGGVTCHIAIMMRAWNIPLLTGIPSLMTEVKSGMPAVLDCTQGELILEPDAALITQAEHAMEKEGALSVENQAYTLVYTKDNEPVYLTANIAFSDEAMSPLVQHCAGIGLYRSEFLFLGNAALPDEQTQYTEYRKVLEAMQTKPVVIRTFDAGSDKMLAEQAARGEKNALLGWRGIRYCLDRPDIFKTQLRAIIRAACYGTAHIMLPMISSIEEIYAAKTLLQEAMQECEQQKLPYKKDIPLGIMIEVPSTAIAADIYAPLVDFFSIGTNDLVQYTMAADRQNSSVAALADYFQPAVLRLIAQVIAAGSLLPNQAKGFVSMCGEMASQEEAIPLLLGMGLRHFSMSAQRFPTVKKRIESLSIMETQALYAKIRTLPSAAHIRKAVQEVFPDD